MLTDDEIVGLVTHARGVWRKASSEQFDELTVTLAEFGWLTVPIVRQAISEAARVSAFLDLPSLVQRMRVLVEPALIADAQHKRRAANEQDRRKWQAWHAQERAYQIGRQADLEWAAGLREEEFSRRCEEVLAANESMRPFLARRNPRTDPAWIGLLRKVPGYPGIHFGQVAADPGAIGFEASGARGHGGDRG
jgi:hypothetical protein